MFSFYILFLLCIAGHVASVPIASHRHHLQHHSGPFPYGKLANKLLNVNNNEYMIDDLDEDIDRVYPENHSPPFSSLRLPISSFELKLPLPVNTILPNDVDSKNLRLLSLPCRMLDIIKKAVTQEWDTRWRTMARDQ